ncbi:MAG TPA: type II toxin-antitoxin system VapC family toxin [Thermoanaerobaculia bacterium]|nr:type II toxin-antitoxin system VapC family toxin [Thermoanaerobaculia bacterium]
MVIDSSALLAILLGEPEADRFARLVALEPRRLASAVSALETAIVIHARKGPAGVRELDLLLHAAGVTIVSLDAEQVLGARAAYEKYGKGHHPAALNLGDCCSYALAHSSGQPLLFKGDDFARTDVTAVA